jgi:hypothetical protein
MLHLFSKITGLPSHFTAGDVANACFWPSILCGNVSAAERVLFVVYLSVSGYYSLFQFRQWLKKVYFARGSGFLSRLPNNIFGI